MATSTLPDPLLSTGREPEREGSPASLQLAEDPAAHLRIFLDPTLARLTPAHWAYEVLNAIRGSDVALVESQVSTPSRGFTLDMLTEPLGPSRQTLLHVAALLNQGAILRLLLGVADAAAEAAAADEALEVRSETLSGKGTEADIVAYQTRLGAALDKVERKKLIKQEEQYLALMHTRDATDHTVLHYCAASRGTAMRAALEHGAGRFLLARTSEYAPGAPTLLFHGNAHVVRETGTEWVPALYEFPEDHDPQVPPPGSLAVSELLSARKVADFVDPRDALGATPLHFATVANDVRAIRALLEHGADPFAVTSGGATPLELCSNRTVRNALVPMENAVQISVGLMMMRSGMPATVRATSPARGSGGSTGGSTLSVTRAARREAAEKALVLLVNAGESINDRTGIKMQAPLHVATEQGNAEVVELLLENGAIVDITDVDGRTPLHYGAEAGTEAHMRCVSLLFDAGANVNATSSQRKTPLHMAATGGPAFEAGFKLLRPLPPMDAPPSHPPGGTADGNSAMVSHLTKLGANLEAVDLEGNTPLLAAARCNNHLCVQRLLLLGARVYHANVRGHTALHLAAFHHCEPAVRQLVRWDAEVGKLKFILDSSGRSAYDMAANSSTRAALHTLFEAAASGRLDLVQAVARDTALLPAAAQNPWLPVRVWESTRVTARGVLHCVVTGAARAMAQLRKDCEKPGAAERMAAAAALGGGSNQRVADALFKSVAQRRERENRVNGAKGTGLPAHKIAPSAVHIVAGMGLRFVTDHRRDAAVGGALPAQEYRDWGGDFADVLLTFPVVADPFLLEQSVDATAFVPRPGAHKMFIPTSILGDASRSEAAAARVVPGNELTSSVTEKEYGRVLDFLLKAGAAVEHGDRDGVTPLHLAAKYGLLFLVRKLLKAGASPTARDKELNTPFHYAAAFCQPAAADILGEFAKEGDDAAQQRNAAGQAPADVGGMGMLILPRAAEGDIVVQRYPPKSKSLAVTKAM